jgi:hypothetical protein
MNSKNTPLPDELSPSEDFEITIGEIEKFHARAQRRKGWLYSIPIAVTFLLFVVAGQAAAYYQQEFINAETKLREMQAASGQELTQTEILQARDNKMQLNIEEPAAYQNLNAALDEAVDIQSQMSKRNTDFAKELANKQKALKTFTDMLQQRIRHIDERLGLDEGMMILNQPLTPPVLQQKRKSPLQFIIQPSAPCEAKQKQMVKDISFLENALIEQRQILVNTLNQAVLFQKEMQELIKKLKTSLDKGKTASAELKTINY